VFSIDLPMSYDVETAVNPKIAFTGVVTALRFSK
jgi:hypothetical protein